MSAIRVQAPLTDEQVRKLNIGQKVLISGEVYTARDAAHKLMVELLQKGEKLPVDLRGQIVYYVGPTPAKPGQVIGSAGPTTSGRMDAYTPVLLKTGLKGMIGKGARSREVREAMQKYGAVYFAAVGGSAALLAQYIKEAEVVAYEHLGTEAVRRLIIEDFPAIVVNDAHGRDLYQEGKAQYRRV
ncbi:Fe-S-containing hydro-lyase [Calderihabitans maritimus]|uniref:Hydro-lyase, Fe-S type, tartrate/fumarate subfamily, beta subunit n=1 Tax=Calderihabitans maritimus TaxID=1246530 RepID=A0A1Z5HU18_9FIRM|nr:Fe-S-containing hydro-lyase [Calderihabitans maritimus]GAW92815.1 Hydro-lyase, Fe-S type, tartrate/fumarate subfamily, beta subunit [Calderihabitans maritimus]